jgi:octaprenyl-diphosphate synthase
VKSRKAVHLASAPSAARLSPGQLVASELKAVEQKLQHLLDSREGMIAEICHYLIDGGGKRMRPLFVLLVYRACGGTESRIEDPVDAAIALELIHSATLLHDDIVDAGMLRRGKPSAFSKYGLGPTLIAGDYLFSRAFELCGRFEEHLVRMAADACIQLTEGEVMEGRFRHNSAVSFNDYVAVITRKTASLFRAGGRVAADLAGAPKPLIAAMGDLGLAIGLAFQMVDDLLDIIGPEEKIGKPVGSDLRAGIPSLPVVLGVERNPELKKIFESGGGIEGAGFDRALELLRAPELLAQARSMAAEQASNARSAVFRLKPSRYRDSLAAFIDDQVDRDV